MTTRKGGGESPLIVQLVAECDAMARYALASGLKVPANAFLVLSNITEDLKDTGPDDPTPRDSVIARVVSVHCQLARLVAPATPRTLLLLSHECKNSRLSFIGPVRLVRHMMVAAIVLLLTFMFTALSPYVTNASGNIFDSHGLDLLVNELFLLAAAGIGAAFTALFRANRYIAVGTYDPKYESSYWVRFILGLMAGIVLAALIPTEGSGQTFTRPLLALVGGFSASVVYTILCRLVDTLESLFQGDGGATAASREQAIRAEVTEQRFQDQLRLAAVLIKLRNEIDAVPGADELKASVARILDELVPADADADGPDEPPAGPELIARDRPRPVVAS
jgi:hypothetical protein